MPTRLERDEGITETVMGAEIGESGEGGEEQSGGGW